MRTKVGSTPVRYRVIRQPRLLYCFGEGLKGPRVSVPDKEPSIFTSPLRVKLFCHPKGLFNPPTMVLTLRKMLIYFRGLLNTWFLRTRLEETKTKSSVQPAYERPWARGAN